MLPPCNRAQPFLATASSTSGWLVSGLRWVLVLALHNAVSVHAFIPAQPVNDTSSFNQSQDLITVAFYNGVYQAPISRQLTAEAFDDQGNYTDIPTIVSWTRFSKGVLVHFDEADRNQGPSNVPWIAMINCDTNGTSYSLEDDIFTLTRDQGAQAALLYSLHSQGCLMNQEYIRNFSKVLDVYATTTVSASRIIENQFFNPGISTSAYNFNASLLNTSVTTIDSLLNSASLYVTGNVPTNASLSTSDTVESDNSTEATKTYSIDPTDFTDATDSTSSATPSATRVSNVESEIFQTANYTGATTQQLQAERRQRMHVLKRATATRTSSIATSTGAPNYLAAVMAASNNTVGGTSIAQPSATVTPAASKGDRTGTSLAMIILYAITGIVTFMFFVVILSGAIRAIRHPERYGPRATMYDDDQDGGGGGYAQTRTQGLTRAILDTFPVVKFGRGQHTRVETETRGEPQNDGSSTSPHKAVEMEAVRSAQRGEEPILSPPIHLAGTTRLTPAEIKTLPLSGRISTSSDSRQTLTHRPSNASDMSFVCAMSSPEPAPLAAVHTSIPTSPTSTSPTSPTSPTPPISPVNSNALSSTSGRAALPMSTNLGDVDDNMTCPVCLCEFDEGDDLRLLPCDGRHRFHCECIDPWLLNVSSHCPLCRLDLNGAIRAKNEHSRTEEETEMDEEEVVRANLRAMLPARHRSESTANPSLGTSGGSNPAGGGSSILTANKFFRYVAKKRQQGGGTGEAQVPPISPSNVERIAPL
ncbi:hypothetical protein MVLG_00374 [Microbotryum lychnidis-dioicae p1A1 Lamole]|uniref:RING-type domain-containing protein n=1 Tax=Microbotryum lychnidis-dioicae (strain p1A1 Lamole / MvSl-1064) TaxID=683840 RepID=U5GYW3_USTV1|nr:hypothetical protein MVLG_00374 [Microbotryum lychnidis-dioicae p1A1 Lamole]|eukprot:KDE09472.1 hypothetical protein MVLG_00374 [Microbotryum lychnidis-dioicae p1A1 Lamole]